jgi:hypothetical protein
LCGFGFTDSLWALLASALALATSNIGTVT